MRLRDKVHTHGLERLEDQDVLAIVLSNGRDEIRCRQLAALLLEDFGGLSGLWRLSHAGLPSLSEATALRLAAALEIGLRCLEQRTRRTCVRSSADVSRILGSRLARSLHEQVWLLALDSRNGVIARRRVAEGGLHGCAIQASDVLRAALSLGASSFVLVHNHPGGDATPSRQDLQLTRRICEAACCVGVPLVDHVIIAGDEHRSLLDLGVMHLPLSQPQDASAAAQP